ncbi:MAG: RluA family pseudouridine synthase [Oscillibacter sp.]|jgi:RluA family pseudouridine synthase|nr:RluA family pseudouridine synthase [Oscillibacter sp.]
MQTISWTVSPSEDGKKLRSVLKGSLGLSSHALASLTHTKTGIQVNGSRPLDNIVLYTGDVITVEVGDRKPPSATVVPLDAPLDIVYEDEHLLVVNKPAGMVSLASLSRPDSPSVPSVLAYRYGVDVPFHIVNRLDKGTSGLMVVSKNGYTHNLLRQMLHSPEFCREYRGISVGCPSEESGIIDLPIGRAEGSIVKRMIRPDGAPSISRYQVLQRRGNLTLLALIPETGRTHQLRVHCAAISCPLAGDWLYGTEDHALIARPALHSYALHLRHPVTGRQLELTAPLPEDMVGLLEPFRS